MGNLVMNSGFNDFARFAAFIWVIVSVSEVYLLFYWEAGVKGATQEVDAFSYTKEFFLRYSPDLEGWSFARVIVGNWREPFYFMLLFPKSSITCLITLFV